MIKLSAFKAIFAVGAIASLLPAGLASALTVDGQIGDWGVTNLSSNIANYSGVAGNSWAATAYEGDGFLHPGGGGQNYDLEFMAIHIDDALNTLYGVVMSGQRNDNGATKFSPGDIFFEAWDANNSVDVTFALEVGGGFGGTGITSVGLGDAGTTYNLNSSGYTQSAQPASYLAGDLVKSPGFVGGHPFSNPSSGGSPMVQMLPDAGATSFGPVAEFIFLQDASLYQHSVIEFSIDLDSLGLGEEGGLTSAVWAPGCGNDHGRVEISAPVPEPSGILLMCSGLLVLGIAGVGRPRA